jgi:hypothetical protein
MAYCSCGRVALLSCELAPQLFVRRHGDCTRQGTDSVSTDTSVIRYTPRHDGVLGSGDIAHKFLTLTVGD